MHDLLIVKYLLIVSVKDKEFTQLNPPAFLLIDVQIIALLDILLMT